MIHWPDSSQPSQIRAVKGPKKEAAVLGQEHVPHPVRHRFSLLPLYWVPSRVQGARRIRVSLPGRSSALQLSGSVRISLWVLACILYFLTLLQAQVQQPPEEMFRIGVEHLRSGRLADAETVFKQILAGGNSAPFVHHNLGIVYQRLRRHKEAIQEFRQALGMETDLPETRALLGASLLAARLPAEGIQELEKAVAGLPNDLLVRSQLAGAYQSQRRYPEAVQQYQKLSEKDPQNPEYLYKLGSAYLALSQWCYREILRRDPESSRRYQFVGQNHLIRGALEPAAEAILKAIERAPRLPDLHLILAQIYLRQRNLKDALMAIERELEIVPENLGAQQLRRQLILQIETEHGSKDD
jgi:tetratricopeptide (TPR) repeat protein